MINLPRQTNSLLPWQQLGFFFFLLAQIRLLSIPDLDWHRKLAATVGHPLHCMPTPWPSHATLESDTLNTNARAHTHKTGRKKPFQHRHIFLPFTIAARPQTISDARAAHFPSAASTIAFIQVYVHSVCNVCGEGNSFYNTLGWFPLLKSQNLNCEWKT